MYSPRQCKKRTYLCGSANYPISCKAVYFREGNLGKFGPTFRHVAVFAPKCIPLIAAKRALTCAGPQTTPTHVRPRQELNHPVPRQSKPATIAGMCMSPRRERKFAEIRVYLLPWYRVCNKAMFISKGSYACGESKNVFLLSVQKPHLCGTTNDPVSCKGV